MNTKIRDWSIYCEIVYGTTLIEQTGDYEWPCPFPQWSSFLDEARVKVKSYKRFLNLISNVVSVGRRFFARKLAGEIILAKDPLAVWGPRHAEAMVTIKREYGIGGQQIEAINMIEAKNGPHFVDHNSLLGINRACAWNVGCKMGGKRPRALTNLRCKHVLWDLAVCDGEFATHVKITFSEEKHDDQNGPREGNDEVDFEDFEERKYRSVWYWLYKVFLHRGLFEQGDPVEVARNGGCPSFELKEGVKDFYVFCRTQPNTWQDCIPTSVSILAEYTYSILRAMGHRERGLSAHRSGCVTRACIQTLIENKGVALPMDRLHLVARWGGWEYSTGLATMLKTYARKVLDIFTCTGHLAFGDKRSDVWWDKKLIQYIGPKLRPTSAIYDHGVCNLDMAEKVKVWRTVTWTNYMKLVNSASSELMRWGRTDMRICEMNRYVEEAVIYKEARVFFANREVALDLHHLLGRVVEKRVWESAMQEFRQSGL